MAALREGRDGAPREALGQLEERGIHGGLLDARRLDLARFPSRLEAPQREREAGQALERPEGREGSQVRELARQRRQRAAQESAERSDRSDPLARREALAVLAEADDGDAAVAREHVVARAGDPRVAPGLAERPQAQRRRRGGPRLTGEVAEQLARRRLLLGREELDPLRESAAPPRDLGRAALCALGVELEVAAPLDVDEPGHVLGGAVDDPARRLLARRSRG